MSGAQAEPGTLEAMLEAFLENGQVVVIGNSGREEFRAAELGLSFDGKMIYDREKLAELFAANDGMELEDAFEWIDFNITGTGEVLVVS